MIKDKENARYIHFGHGTVKLSRCKDGASYAIYNSEYEKVDGEYSDSIYTGRAVEDIPVKSVAFAFDGPAAEKSLDILIEDLMIIKNNLKERSESESLEEKFFRVFEIEPFTYCGDEYIHDAMLESECKDGNEDKCKTCRNIRKVYPEITERILLDLSCIALNCFGSISVDEDMTQDKLKEKILKMLIMAQGDVYSKVQNLFERSKQ